MEELYIQCVYVLLADSAADNVPNASFKSPPVPTDYLYIVDLKKNTRRLPLARLLSPERADMDCGIDLLSREI